MNIINHDNNSDGPKQKFLGKVATVKNNLQQEMQLKK